MSFTATTVLSQLETVAEITRLMGLHAYNWVNVSAFRICFISTSIRIDGPNFGSAVKVFIIFAIGGWLKERGILPQPGEWSLNELPARAGCGPSVGPANLIYPWKIFALAMVAFCNLPICWNRELGKNDFLCGYRDPQWESSYFHGPCLHDALAPARSCSWQIPACSLLYYEWKLFKDQSDSFSCKQLGRHSEWVSLRRS